MVSRDGTERVGGFGALFSLAPGAVAYASGNNTLITPPTGKALRIKYASYNPITDIDCKFVIGSQSFLFNRVPASSIVAKDFKDNYIEGFPNEPLIFNTSGAVTCFVNIFYELI